MGSVGAEGELQPENNSETVRKNTQKADNIRIYFTVDPLLN